MKHYILKFSFLLLAITTQTILISQNGTVKGKIYSQDGEAAFATVYIKKINKQTIADANGNYELTGLKSGNFILSVFYAGYKDFETNIEITSSQITTKNITLTRQNLMLNPVVVTGTKTEKRQTESPVIVNVMNSRQLSDLQVCNLSEGLKFQPGLRVETNCQTCNYTQLRMNGLAGGYSQILINGRPIFSPLTGLYGMEQLPVNMIERIEVIRGGGSSLYGSSAIGGTVNIITKTPQKSGYEIGYSHNNINGKTGDNQLLGNLSIVADNKKSGLSFFVNHRKRGFYDHNNDNYSELPLLNNTALGTNFFLIPTENQKLEVSISKLNEYRFGGEMDLITPAYLTEQSEERAHDVWMGSADYQINFNEFKSSLIGYLAWQNTDRKHYTGIIPDIEDSIAFNNHIINPPYGTSKVTTYNVGVQLNHKIEQFLGGTNVFTLGSEFVYDYVNDNILAYNYLIDQTTENFGTFIQSDWAVTSKLNLLSGFRIDAHNLINKLTFNPRASLLYKPQPETQIRLGYGTGFRAPQAFDSDLHIAFAGGGISRVSLSPNLLPETSQSLNASINQDYPAKNYVWGYTIEGFYTKLDKAFYLNPVGEDEFGEQFVKENGQSATVQGVTFELRTNINGKAQLEAGFTTQKSAFENEVKYIDELEGIKDFIRTPNNYGFANLTLTPNKKWSGNINFVYTGSMIIPHFGGAPNQLVDEIINSPSFSELSAKISYTFPITKLQFGMEVFAGVKNVLNAYQTNFDIGKNRDSNFVFGPAQPRTIFIGVKLMSL